MLILTYQQLHQRLSNYLGSILQDGEKYAKSVRALVQREKIDLKSNVTRHAVELIEIGCEISRDITTKLDELQGQFRELHLRDQNDKLYKRLIHRSNTLYHHALYAMKQLYQLDDMDDKVVWRLEYAIKRYLRFQRWFSHYRQTRALELHNNAIDISWQSSCKLILSKLENYQAAFDKQLETLKIYKNREKIKCFKNNK